MRDLISLFIALCLLREFFWVPNKGPALQRLAVAFLVLLLAACAPKHEGRTCYTEVNPQLITWPDGHIRKSDVARCSNGMTRIAFVNDYSQYFDIYDANPEGYLPPSVNN